jgi:hypothetical protein
MLEVLADSAVKFAPAGILTAAVVALRGSRDVLRLSSGAPELIGHNFSYTVLSTFRKAL